MEQKEKTPGMIKREQNLKKSQGRLARLPKEEIIAMTLKGVEVREAKRAQQKKLAEIIEIMFAKKSDTKSESGGFLTMKEKSVLQAVLQASQGDLKALELLAKITGEEKTQIEIQGLPPINMAVFGFED